MHDKRNADKTPRRTDPVCPSVVYISSWAWFRISNNWPFAQFSRIERVEGEARLRYDYIDDGAKSQQTRMDRGK